MPGRSIVASSGTRSADLHVGGAQLAPDASAAICTPESAWTALRVDATRETACSWASSSCDDVESFTMTTSGEGSKS